MTPLPEAASLSATLLARKGNAQPVTFAPRGPVLGAQPRPLFPMLATAKKAPAEKGPPRARQTLRLDPGRHLQLRLIAAQFGKSRQDLLLAAFDEFVAKHGAGCLCIAGAARPAGEADDAGGREA
jgi:hypothetical protein